MTQSAMSRRTVIGGAAAVGGAALLAACGSDDDSADTSSEDATTDGEDTEGSGEALIATEEVPVGGGAIVGTAKVVVTQPTDGDFRAFSSTCTHQGCQVSSVSSGAIVCACHNSQFSIEDGAVLGGPATAPLPEVAVTVDGDQVVSA